MAKWHDIIYVKPFLGNRYHKIGCVLGYMAVVIEDDISVTLEHRFGEEKVKVEWADFQANWERYPCARHGRKPPRHGRRY